MPGQPEKRRGETLSAADVNRIINQLVSRFIGGEGVIISRNGNNVMVRLAEPNGRGRGKGSVGSANIWVPYDGE